MRRVGLVVFDEQDSIVVDSTPGWSSCV